MASSLNAEISFFFGKKCLKNTLYKNFFRQKLLQIKIHNFWCKIFFDRPTGLASTLETQFGFLAKTALKMCCTKKFSDKSYSKSKATTFILSNIFRYLAPFLSYSGLRNTSRKFCAVLRNRFFFVCANR